MVMNDDKREPKAKPSWLNKLLDLRYSPPTLKKEGDQSHVFSSSWGAGSQSKEGGYD